MFRFVLARASTSIAFRATPIVAPLVLRSYMGASSIAAKRFYAESSTTGDEIPPEVANLSMERYQTESDKFLESLQDDLEALSQKYPESVPEVELNQGVMQLELGRLGSYVINKQPPNKQIWLASPVSGPKRFDLFRGEWISLRDGTKLLDVLNKEVNDAVEEEEVKLLQYKGRQIWSKKLICRPSLARSLATLISTQLAPPSMPGKSFIVTLKENTPDSEVNKFKKSIDQLDGSITHEFSLIKAFTVKIPDEFNFKRLHDTHGTIISNIEEDKEMHANKSK